MTSKIRSPRRWPDDGPVDPLLDAYVKRNFAEPRDPDRMGIGGGERVGRRLTTAYGLGALTDDAPIDDKNPENKVR